MGKFPLGVVVITDGVSHFLKENEVPRSEILKLTDRHKNGDWGDVPQEDRIANDAALENGSRILSSYKLLGEKVWIITEADRSYTTILFPHEY